MATFKDDGYSAFKEITRDGFGDLIAAIVAGQVDVVIVRDIDRLTRNLTDWNEAKLRTRSLQARCPPLPFSWAYAAGLLSRRLVLSSGSGAGAARSSAASTTTAAGSLDPLRQALPGAGAPRVAGAPAWRMAARSSALIATAGGRFWSLLAAGGGRPHPLPVTDGGCPRPRPRRVRALRAQARETVDGQAVTKRHRPGGGARWAAAVTRPHGPPRAVPGVPGSATPTSGAASGPPAPAAMIRASCCPPCTRSPPWPSAGCWAPTRARSMRRTCRHTSASSRSASTCAGLAAAGWSQCSTNAVGGSRSGSPTVSRGQPPFRRSAAELTGQALDAFDELDPASSASGVSPYFLLCQTRVPARLISVLPADAWRRITG